MHALRNFFVTSAVTIAALAFASCNAQASGWHTYRDPNGLFSVAYPPGWSVDTSHTYTALGPGKEIHGVAFKVNPDFTKGTNLSTDSYFAVEVLPGAAQCTPDLFLDDAVDKVRTKPGRHGITWLVLDGADAGAGNIYDETVQAAADSKPCIATRAFAHSTNVGNYDPGTVKAFNAAAFNRTIDRMRASLRLSLR
ncbi:MAG TPA: hypothetical protein VIM56_14090 [Rhizomicrobium sp.]